ncbi:WLM domain-containing protein [Rhexocercosporidium sp. MPI-PUGE-AT-0058]|nr:WLM domain-containing protein [Rhexocercosporidium sp. MPI-PUGE-AT-0058]
MPLGWERINVKQSQPNKNIVFIKPLPGPDETTSKDYLERIAAQCLPIMNRHHLAVVSLEEYEPNLEFWGRNFNNGEVIQLVLKSPSTGHWLPFNFVQMVMMHELAHNKQMNHSKAFWAVRNEFAAEMKGLWEKKYTGEGLWGRGVLLENGAFARDTLESGEVLPEHMCGGTFRSRGGKKRKVKPKITYKEAKERRIRKKFGASGVALGADEEVKTKLEKGKKPAGKPRVAGSARGRELRAAAALARFEVKGEEPQIKDEDFVTDSEAESDVEGGVYIKPEPDDAIDINGERLIDNHGRGMVRVCEDEDKNDDDARRELLELQSIPGHSQQYFSKTVIKSEPSSSRPSTSSSKILKADQTLNPQTSAQVPVTRPSKEATRFRGSSRSEPAPKGGDAVYKKPQVTEKPGSCPVCSVNNEPNALTCMVCANVLKPEFVAGSWRCKSSACEDGQYVNAGDVGLCGVCGTRK